MERLDTSRIVQAKDWEESWFKARCAELNTGTRLHRKVWEFVVIAQAFLDHLPTRLSRCLGFGVGLEPLPAWLASRGAEVVATDLEDSQWEGQRSAKLEDLPWKGICQESQLQRIKFIPMDMNAIPDDHLRGRYDFTWSAGSFEHIGGIDASLRFFCNQMRALKPGGVAAHTTEYNVFSNTRTLEAKNLVIFRRRDLEKLDDILRAQGDLLLPLDLTPGDTEADRFVDFPPYGEDPHLRLRIGIHVTTSVLLIAIRGGAKAAGGGQ